MSSSRQKILKGVSEFNLPPLREGEGHDYSTHARFSFEEARVIVKPPRGSQRSDASLPRVTRGGDREGRAGRVRNTAARPTHTLPPYISTRTANVQASDSFINRPTLSQMWPERERWAAIYVQDFDAPCVLQFAWISALCCALHRSTSQVIHRSGSYYMTQHSYRLVSPERNSTKFR